MITRRRNGKPRVRVAVAGQVPPPLSGQFVMVEEILAELGECSDLEVIHVPFHFTRDASDQGVRRVGKLVEAARVWIRALAAARRGRVDVAIYPVGGTARTPVLRDVLVLPVFRLIARRLVIHFHAGGHADVWSRRRGPLEQLAGVIYRRADLALVMTPFNTRDPQMIGVSRVAVLPHRIPDNYDSELVTRNPERSTLLYLGHIRSEKGFPELLEAFADVAADEPTLELQVVGEILPPFSREELTVLVQRLGVGDRVTFVGHIRGRSKWEAFGAANLIVFPTRAISESFGLVLIEAMMWELPVIASDWRGNREVVGEDSGILFPVGDHFRRELAEALRQAMQMRDRWQKWGEGNRRRFLERYVRTADRQQLADLIRREASGSPVAGPKSEGPFPST